MKNGAVSYVTRNTAPFFYKAFATIKSIYSSRFNVSLNAKPFAVRRYFCKHSANHAANNCSELTKFTKLIFISSRILSVLIRNEQYLL